MRRLAVSVLFVFSIPLSGTAAQAQVPGAPQCALFTSMSEEHGKKAQAIEQEAAEQAKTLSGDAAKSNADIAARAAKSEWEMAALSREAARKCLQDYLSPSQATAVAPAAPVQQAAPAPVIVRQQPAPVVIRQSAPIVVEQVVPMQQFHATAVSAMAVGGAVLGTPRILEGGSGQRFQAGSSPPGGFSPTQSSRKNTDGSETAFERLHNPNTSAVTSTTTNLTKSPGGGTATNSLIVKRNPDGTVERSNVTTSRTRPDGPVHLQGVGTSPDGVKTEYKARQFQNFTLESVTRTNPDGTVSKQITHTNRKTGAVTVVPNSPPPVSTAPPPSTSGRPTAPPRAIGQRRVQ